MGSRKRGTRRFDFDIHPVTELREKQKRIISKAEQVPVGISHNGRLVAVCLPVDQYVGFKGFDRKYKVSFFAAKSGVVLEKVKKGTVGITCHQKLRLAVVSVERYNKMKKSHSFGAETFAAPSG